MNTSAVQKKLQDIRILEDVEAEIVKAASLLPCLTPETVTMLDSGTSFEECKQSVDAKLSEAQSKNSSFGSNNAPYYIQMLSNESGVLGQCILAMNKANAKLSGASETVYNQKTRRQEVLALSPEAVRLIQSKEMTCSEVVAQWEKDIVAFMMGLHEKKTAQATPTAQKGFQFVPPPPALAQREEKKSQEYKSTATICELLDVLEEMLDGQCFPCPGCIGATQLDKATFSLADLIAVTEHGYKDFKTRTSFHKKLARLWERLDHQTQERLSQGVAIRTVIQELSAELASRNKSLSKVPAKVPCIPQQ